MQLFIPSPQCPPRFSGLPACLLPAYCPFLPLSHSFPINTHQHPPKKPHPSAGLDSHSSPSPFIACPVLAVLPYYEYYIVLSYGMAWHGMICTDCIGPHGCHGSNGSIEQHLRLYTIVPAQHALGWSVLHGAMQLL